MDRDAVLALFDRQMRQHVPVDNVRAQDPGAVMERVGHVVRHVSTGDGWNGIEWSDLDETTADAEIAEQVRYFGSLGREFEWKLYSYDRPADLGARLRAAGFVAEPEEALMVAQVSELPTSVDLPDGIRLRTVTDEAGVDLMADVHEQAFGISASQLRLRMLDQLAHSPDTVSMVVAMAGDVPVCAARMELHPGTDFASLWGGGTVAAWRGRGIYRALVAHRTRLVRDLGYRYLQVDASDQSRPILRRLGFEILSTTTPYTYEP